MDLPIKSIETLLAEGEAAVSNPAPSNPYPVGSDHHFHWERGYIARQLGDAVRIRARGKSSVIASDGKLILSATRINVMGLQP